jgi:ketosteroid isomerase-like protein
LKKIRHLFSLLAIITLLLFACKPRKKEVVKNSPAEIIKADEAFSNLSKKLGMKRAFIEYMDNDGVLLRPNHLPIIGANAIDFLSQVNDTSSILTWMPSGAEIAASGELGYTYGVYNLELKDTILKGTYVSIWKKQGDNSWKFILDCGNEGIAQKVSLR